MEYSIGINYDLKNTNLKPTHRSRVIQRKPKYNFVKTWPGRTETTDPGAYSAPCSRDSTNPELWYTSAMPFCNVAKSSSTVADAFTR